MKTLTLLCGAAFVVLQTLSFTVSAAQTLYKPFPHDVMPELSDSGKFAVGVRTVEVAYPEMVPDLMKGMAERSLTLEVWYPAEKGSALASYSNETRSGKRFEIQANAYRDAAIAKSKEKYPVIVISHGYTGYRTLMCSSKPCFVSRSGRRHKSGGYWLFNGWLWGSKYCWCMLCI
jgi:hypothetical protein